MAKPVLLAFLKTRPAYRWGILYTGIHPKSLNFVKDKSRVYVSCRYGKVDRWGGYWPMIKPPVYTDFSEYEPIIPGDDCPTWGWGLTIDIRNFTFIKSRPPVDWWLRGITYKVPEV